jgi:protein phosphatase
VAAAEVTVPGFHNGFSGGAAGGPAESAIAPLIATPATVTIDSPAMSTSFPLDGMRVRFSGDTNVGMKREHNEDSFYLPKSERLAIVADGMGGHASGEVASRMAVDTIVGFFGETEEEQALTWPFKVDRGQRHDVNRMVTAIKLANLKIHQEAQRNPACHGMGTTVVSTLFLQNALIVGHVGDSRVYRMREGMFDLLTEDHSLLNDYIKMKHLSPEEIAAFPHKNVIVRALGMKPSVQVDVIVESPRLGDVYVLCSDGLSSMVPDSEIAGVMAEEPDLDRMCDSLIATANGNGGLDNVTVVGARIERD